MKQNSKLITEQKQKNIVSAYAAAKNRAIILDYDGTLRPFVNSPAPSRAIPSNTLMTLLRAIAALPKTDLYIASGRSRDAMESWFHDLPATLIAEHGFWIRSDREWSQEATDFKNYKADIMELCKQYAERTPGATVEEKTFSIVWHYRNVTPELAYARNSNLRHDLQDLLAGSDIGTYSGHKILEIKPHGITKGVALDELFVDKQYDFIFCAGDDYTDEDMFRALPESAFTVKVGQGDTQAQYQLQSPEKLIVMLQNLI